MAKPRRARKARGNLLTAVELAKRWAVSRITIAKWQHDGLPVAKRGARGRRSLYDPVACDAWKAAHDARLAANGDQMSLAAERAKLARMDTEIRAIRKGQLAGQLLDRGLWVRALQEHIALAKAKLLALPATLAESTLHAAADGQAAVEALWRDALEDALRELMGAIPPEASA